MTNDLVRDLDLRPDHLARAVGSHARTARRWRNGEHQPQPRFRRLLALAWAEIELRTRRGRRLVRLRHPRQERRPPKPSVFTAARVRALLDRNHWSVADLAQRVGLTSHAIDHWLRSRGRPSSAVTAILRELERGTAPSSPPADAGDGFGPERLIALKEKHRLSDRRLAAAIGVSVQAIATWRTGTRRPRGAAVILLRRIEADGPPPASQPRRRRGVSR
jgi:DNA-binding transcriptional regulator YiaG